MRLIEGRIKKKREEKENNTNQVIGRARNRLVGMNL